MPPAATVEPAFASYHDFSPNRSLVIGAAANEPGSPSAAGLGLRGFTVKSGFILCRRALMALILPIWTHDLAAEVIEFPFKIYPGNSGL